MRADRSGIGSAGMTVPRQKPHALWGIGGVLGRKRGRITVRAVEYHLVGGAVREIRRQGGKQVAREYFTNPVIAALPGGMLSPEALGAKVDVYFLLGGSIMDLDRRVARLREGGRRVFVHLDLVEGLGRDTVAVDYLMRHIKPDGVISTKTDLLAHAKQIGLTAVQRIFLLDSLSYERGVAAARRLKPDLIEVMPGVMPRVIRELTRELPCPVIAGGLIRTRQDAREALEAGAVAISTSRPELWSQSV